MPTRIIDRIIVFLLDRGELDRRGECGPGIGIRMETARLIGLEIRFVAFRIERRLATLRGCNGDVSTGFKEGIVGGCEFLEPKAGLAARIAKFVMRGENHENFHCADPFG